VLYLIGAGGHCKVVLDALLAGGAPIEEIRIRDANHDLHGHGLLGVGVEYPEIDERMAGASVHVAVGSMQVRGRLYAAIAGFGAAALTVRHPSAQVSPFADIAGGAFIAATAVLGPGARLGVGAIVNHGAVVDHDCVVGDLGHVAPNATLGGGVALEDRVLIGAGAVVLPGLRVGSGATVGAGAVVTRDVGPNEVWIGVPATRQVR